MEYILFDDCYMATVEVAYELRKATDYLIGSTCEIMEHGMPYDIIGKHLLGNVNYKAITEGFYSFYSNYVLPHGTISVTKCSEMDELVAIMRDINQRFTFDEALLGTLQKLDGYNPVKFFDCGDYAAKLCQDPVLLDQFNKQLERAVPYKQYTEYYYSMGLPSPEQQKFILSPALRYPIRVFTPRPLQRKLKHRGTKPPINRSFQSMVFEEENS